MFHIPMNETGAPHNPLLRWQESELYEAEAKVLKAFREGWKADSWLGKIAVPPEGGNTPQKPAEGHTADDWQDAILRAGFLRDLFLGNYGDFDPRPIVISRSWIKGQLDLDNCESRLPLKFSRCIFSNGIALQNAIIPELQLSECEVRRLPRSTFSLFAQQAKVGTNVFLNDGFKSDGGVSLVGASLGGVLSCDGDFENGLRASDLEANEVRLSDGFKADEEVNLFGADISGGLVCDGDHFEKGLRAANLKTGEGVWLIGKFNGVMNLAGANIGGQLVCTGGRFEKGLNAQSLKTGEDVRLGDKFKSNGVVNLRSAEIGGQLYCAGGHFEKGLTADGLRYQSIDLGGDWKESLNWLRKMRKNEFQPYEQLMSVYRRMGHINWAREIGFALEEKRSKEFKGRKLLKWRIWYGILGCTIGYGYKPFRFLRWAAGLVIAGFLLFSSGYNGIVSKYAPPSWPPLAPPLACLDNKWIPSEAEALESQPWKRDRKPPPDYPPFNPLIYSLEATFPVLPLGQLEKWHPSNPCLLIVRWALTLIGTPLLAILALFGAGVLGPRWRSGDEGG